jgi:hypothetical protein
MEKNWYKKAKITAKYSIKCTVVISQETTTYDHDDLLKNNQRVLKIAGVDLKQKT